MYIFDTELWEDLKQVLSTDLQFRVNGHFVDMDFDYKTKKRTHTFSADRIFDLSGIKNVTTENESVALVEYEGNVYNCKTGENKFRPMGILPIHKSDISKIDKEGLKIVTQYPFNKDLSALKHRLYRFNLTERFINRWHFEQSAVDAITIENPIVDHTDGWEEIIKQGKHTILLKDIDYIQQSDDTTAIFLKKPTAPSGLSPYGFLYLNACSFDAIVSQLNNGDCSKALKMGLFLKEANLC